jgi:hypothetical protein
MVSALGSISLLYSLLSLRFHLKEAPSLDVHEAPLALRDRYCESPVSQVSGATASDRFKAGGRMCCRVLWCLAT